MYKNQEFPAETVVPFADWDNVPLMEIFFTKIDASNLAKALQNSKKIHGISFEGRPEEEILKIMNVTGYRARVPQLFNFENMQRGILPRAYTGSQSLRELFMTGRVIEFRDNRDQRNFGVSGLERRIVSIDSLPQLKEYAASKIISALDGSEDSVREALSPLYQRINEVREGWRNDKGLSKNSVIALKGELDNLIEKAKKELRQKQGGEEFSLEQVKELANLLKTGVYFTFSKELVVKGHIGSKFYSETEGQSLLRINMYPPGDVVASAVSEYFLDGIRHPWLYKLCGTKRIVITREVDWLYNGRKLELNPATK